MEGYYSMNSLFCFVYPPAGNPWRREREAVRLAATDAHRQPMPKLAEAWATTLYKPKQVETERGGRSCRLSLRGREARERAAEGVTRLSQEQGSKRLARA